MNPETIPEDEALSVERSELNVERSAPKGAVFLSYAREDTDAARRIADALRAFGVEVWFDQSELRGGDSWDQKIRRQIKDCALFMPIVSEHTQARGEGYFRLEWKLAAERTHLMAEGRPFVLPLVVDDAREADALVPPEFMRVQWTRLPLGVPTPQFVEQVQRLLASPADAGRGLPTPPPSRANPIPAGSGDPALQSKPRVPSWAWAALAVALFVSVLWWKLAPHSAASGESGPPVVVLMDTTYPDRVYDSTTQKSGGSNADDITDALRGLPITIIKEATNSRWNREAEVLKESPALIVMHRSGFYTFPESMAGELYPVLDNKLVAFLGYIATLNPRTKFILYSRHSWEDAVNAAKWREDAANRFPALAGRIETWRVPLDRATFRNPITAQELRDSVAKTLGLPNTR
jgi:hypothetical protein